MIRPLRSAFVYAALAFHELSEVLSIWLKSLAVLKGAGPFAPSLCVHLIWVRAAENNNGKRLNVADSITPPSHLKRLMRAGLAPVLFFPLTHYFKYSPEVIIHCIAFST